MTIIALFINVQPALDFEEFELDLDLNMFIEGLELVYQF